jgi:hypothetical protein
MPAIAVQNSTWLPSTGGNRLIIKPGGHKRATRPQLQKLCHQPFVSDSLLRAVLVLPQRGLPIKYNPPGCTRFLSGEKLAPFCIPPPLLPRSQSPLIVHSSFLPVWPDDRGSFISPHSSQVPLYTHVRIVSISQTVVFPSFHLQPLLF